MPDTIESYLSTSKAHKENNLDRIVEDDDNNIHINDQNLNLKHIDSEIKPIKIDIFDTFNGISIILITT